MSDPSPDRARALRAAESFDGSKPAFLECEFETYRLLREHLPIARIHHPPAGLNPAGRAFLVTRYEDARDLLRNTADFSSQVSAYPVRPWIPQAIDPPAHTVYRRILNPFFSADRMRRLDPHIERTSRTLLADMLQSDAFDFVAAFADPLPTVIFCQLMGFPSEDHRRLTDWKNIIMHGNDGHSRGRALLLAKAAATGVEVGPGGQLAPEAELQVRVGAVQETYGYFAALIEQRRSEPPRDDLISHLLGASYEGGRPLTQEELEDTLFLLFMAGLDTVASVLGLIVHGFARTPAKRREFVALMDDPDRLGPAIEELVRYHAIVTVPRRVTRDLRFRGQRLEDGDGVACPTAAVNRDPSHFPNGDDLVFDRVPNRHAGFGLGPHRCLGVHLARRELRIALRTLHQLLPDYRLHADHQPELFAGMKGVGRLWLVKG